MYVDLRKRHFWCFRGLRGIFTKILYKKPWKITYVRVEFAEYYRKIGFISTFNPMVKFPWPKNEKYRNWHNLMRKAVMLFCCTVFLFLCVWVCVCVCVCDLLWFSVDYFWCKNENKSTWPCVKWKRWKKNGGCTVRFWYPRQSGASSPSLISK